MTFENVHRVVHRIVVRFIAVGRVVARNEKVRDEVAAMNTLLKIHESQSTWSWQARLWALHRTTR